MHFFFSDFLLGSDAYDCVLIFSWEQRYESLGGRVGVCFDIKIDKDMFSNESLQLNFHSELFAIANI